MVLASLYSMAKALLVRYDLHLGINGIGTHTPASMLYFPDERVLIQPSVERSPAGIGFVVRDPKILYGQEAEEWYKVQKDNLDNLNPEEPVDVPVHILAWAKLFPQDRPTMDFRQKLYEYLLPFPLPSTEEAEIIKYEDKDLGDVVGALYFPAQQILLKPAVLNTDENSADMSLDIYYGTRAIKAYSGLEAVTDGRSSITVPLTIVEDIRDMRKGRPLSQELGDFVVTHLFNQFETPPHY